MKKNKQTPEQIALNRIKNAAQKNASRLVLSGLDIKDLPTEIGELKNLTELYLNINKLTYLPPEIGNLSNLILLDLSINHLIKLPPEIGRLKKLKTLDVSVNQLASLPPQIGELSNLESLRLTKNQITAIPPEIGQLSGLTTLNLSNNLLTSLPVEVGRLINLKFLHLGENFIPIPPEILHQVEPNLVLAYFLEHIKRPLNEAKILVVGQGSVGKTSLVSRLLYDRFNSDETKTNGISINQWEIEHIKKGKLKLRLNVWDFGGQEIMHATHQFFLTKRSFYLLVVDARLTQEENRVEYWLKIIQSFGGNSPILIVGNKVDEHPLDIDRSGLRNKYPQIVGIVEASASEGIGIEALKAEIVEQSLALPHVSDMLPDTWFNVKTQIERLGSEQNYITQDFYQKLCIQNGVTDITSQQTLINFLHDLGVVLHFQDDPRLEALGILNPHWVTKGVYKILNSYDLFQSKGVLTKTILDEILDDPEYPPEKRMFIVDMMRKFELCYDIDANQSFLVPDLLPKDEPFTGDWDDALAFQFHYNVLPSSIMSRFIVRMNAFIHKTVWRSGIILKNEANTALVKADTEDRKIYIWVSGDKKTRRDFLAVIRYELIAIHKSIIKIEVREKVPIPNRTNIVIDYIHLLKLDSKGMDEFIPEGLDYRISVRQLLEYVVSPKKRQQDLKIAQIASEKPPLFLNILEKIFITFPKMIGRIVLDIFGRENARNQTAIVLGYILIAIAIAVLFKRISVDEIVNIFKDIWRFFFPIK
jgi:internalin A